MVEQHSFVIPLSRLREKIEKHTSSLGRYRSADGVTPLLERFSFTEGEGFLFDDYLPEAATKTYNWIKAFGRNVRDGYLVYHGATAKDVLEKEGIRISLAGVEFADLDAYIPLTASMYDVVKRAGSADDYDITVHLPSLVISKGDAAGYKYTVKVKYTTIADGIFVDNFTHQAEFTVTADVTITDYVFMIKASSAGFSTLVINVDSIEVVVEDTTPAVTYTKGELIRYIKKDGTILFGVQRSNGNTLDVGIWYDEDIRNSVIFKVELPDWQDRNMIPAAADALEWAIADYMMYRWFETVQEPAFYRGRKVENLADTFYFKWEEKVHDAQMALNSERRILQRKSTWL